MIIADFSNTDDIVIYSQKPLFQYDSGQHLNIIGLDVEYFEQIEFITDVSDVIITESEEITDGFRVEIPDSILSESGHYKDYWINVYITFNDGAKLINTVRVVKIYVKLLSDSENYSNTTKSTISVSDDGNGNVVIS